MVFSRAFGLSCLVGAGMALSACGQPAQLPFEAGVGPQPRLPAPQQALVPTINIAKARGWPAGTLPTVAPGLVVKAFAQGLDHPRWLYTLPNGDVLVAESNAPSKPNANGGIKGWVMKQVMTAAGAATLSANRITLLRDADRDGVAETRSVLLEGLNSPFGIALIGERLYVANTDAIVSFVYQTGQTRIGGPAEKLLDLPAGPLNHHWTKNIIASKDGKRLYVTVGSNSNVAENGMAIETGRAAIWEVDIGSGAHRLFATGMRNPNGMGWEPDTGVLWTVVNERDELGSDLVPDYLTSVRDGAFYGWPWSYYGQHVDTRVTPVEPAMVARAIAPDYALGAHVAPLGMVFSVGQGLGPLFANGVFIGEHGSWNRKPRSGYKVVYVPFSRGQPNGLPIDVVTGFVRGDEAFGRPVGVAIDRLGGLLVADDVGNTVWRVSAVRP
ncbi:sorbosone dehydrogenase family protein [Hydrogenophaga sp. PAMC20947]|nr:sorbosone dehydrogenase family protein [Hydrogenophaga sp. PAMC20947]